MYQMSNTFIRLYHQRSRDSSSIQRLLKVLIKDIFSNTQQKLKIGKIIIYFDFEENVLFFPNNNKNSGLLL